MNNTYPFVAMTDYIVDDQDEHQRNVETSGFSSPRTFYQIVNNAVYKNIIPLSFTVRLEILAILHFFV